MHGSMPWERGLILLGLILLCLDLPPLLEHLLHVLNRLIDGCRLA